MKLGPTFDPSLIGSPKFQPTVEEQMATIKKKETHDKLKNEIIDAIKKYDRKFAGVAQGSPISPFIFALCVDDYFFKEISNEEIKCLAYADDAIFYGKIKHEKQILKQSKHTGLEINIEKSGGVKRENKGLKPLKFLGLSYTEENNKIRGYSSTRSGQTLEFDKELLLKLVELRQDLKHTENELNSLDYERIVELHEEIEKHTEKIKYLESLGIPKMEGVEIGKGSGKSRELDLTELGIEILLSENKRKELSEGAKLKSSTLSEKLTKTGLMGLIQSRLYIGTGTYDISQDFKMSYVENSWTDIQKKKHLKCNIFNASTFAYGDLLNNLRNKSTPELPRKYQTQYRLSHQNQTTTNIKEHKREEKNWLQYGTFFFEPKIYPYYRAKRLM